MSDREHNSQPQRVDTLALERRANREPLLRLAVKLVKEDRLEGAGAAQRLSHAHFARRRDRGRRCARAKGPVSYARVRREYDGWGGIGAVA